MDSIVTIVNKYYTVYLKDARRVHLKSSHHIHTKNGTPIEVMDRLTNLIVVITLQHTRTSNHVVRPKPTQWYVNYSSTKLGGKDQRINHQNGF